MIADRLFDELINESTGIGCLYKWWTDRLINCSGQFIPVELMFVNSDLELTDLQETKD